MVIRPLEAQVGAGDAVDGAGGGQADPERDRSGRIVGTERCRGAEYDREE
jgi:hypothetical protein